MIKPLLFLINGVFDTLSERKNWRFGKFLLVWISFVFPEMMRNSIFDLENGGSTYTRVNTVVLFPTGVYTQTHIYSPSDYFIFSYLRSTYCRALFEYQPSYWIWNRCLNLVLKKQQWTFLIIYFIGLGGGATVTT